MKPIPLKRKRQGKTNYHKRLNLLKSHKPRLVVRKSLRNIQVQIIRFNESGDKVIAGAHSRELIRAGWKASRSSIPAAYLTGYLAAKKAESKGIKEAILDIGLYPSVQGSRLYAALKGFLDGNLTINHDPKIFPSEKRLFGEHIAKDLKKQIEEVKKKLGKVKQ